jgi:hypothetical protein
VLRETGLAPQRLQLEVTESVIMNTGDAMQYINDLHAIGVELAIDDFGTGYSSLAYLKQLPVQTLKIDRSFIKDISTDCQRRGDRDRHHPARQEHEPGGDRGRRGDRRAGGLPAAARLPARAGLSYMPGQCRRMSCWHTWGQNNDARHEFDRFGEGRPIRT